MEEEFEKFEKEMDERIANGEVILTEKEIEELRDETFNQKMPHIEPIVKIDEEFLSHFYSDVEMNIEEYQTLYGKGKK